MSGVGFTVIVAEPTCACEQALLSATLTRLYVKVPDVPVGTLIVATPEPSETTVWSPPPFMLYVKVYGAVPFAPVKVISGDGSSWHTISSEPIVAVGSGTRAIVVWSVFWQPFASVAMTVKISPSTAPVMEGVWSVVFVIVAEPSEDHNQPVASPPTSLTVIGSFSQKGPGLDAVTTGNGGPSTTVTVVVCTHPRSSVTVTV